MAWEGCCSDVCNRRPEHSEHSEAQSSMRHTLSQAAQIDTCQARVASRSPSRLAPQQHIVSTGHQHDGCRVDARIHYPGPATFCNPAWNPFSEQCIQSRYIPVLSMRQRGMGAHSLKMMREAYHKLQRDATADAGLMDLLQGAPDLCFSRQWRPYLAWPPWMAFMGSPVAAEKALPWFQRTSA